MTRIGDLGFTNLLQLLIPRITSRTLLLLLNTCRITILFELCSDPAVTRSPCRESIARKTRDAERSLLINRKPAGTGSRIRATRNLKPPLLSHFYACF
jgi:hypothetical protein